MTRSGADRGQPAWTVARQDGGQRLDRFLAAPDRLGSRSRAADALRRGKVFVNDAEADASAAAVAVKPGDVVRVWLDRPGSARRHAGSFRSAGLAILYEDEALIVVNKPPGLLTVPLASRESAPSVLGQLEEHLRGQRHRPFVVHRIDRDTSGIVLFAKSASAQRELKEQFSRREPARVYLALVHGRVEPASGTWRDRLAWDDRSLTQKEARTSDPRGSEAVCAYRVIEQFATAALIEVSLETGKRNQIRIQAQLRGHPLIGERRYVDGDAIEPIEFPRQALHAHRLSFRHPVDGRAMSFAVPLPGDMRRLLARLRSLETTKATD